MEKVLQAAEYAAFGRRVLGFMTKASCSRWLEHRKTCGSWLASDGVDRAKIYVA
jgi:hypothetical protein